MAGDSLVPALPPHPLQLFLRDFGAYFSLMVTRVDAPLAELMERSSGVPASTWLQLQYQYDEADRKLNPPETKKAAPRRRK